jgi:hypothetical protein
MPQYSVVLGRTFNNSEILALFNVEFKQPSAYGLWRGVHLILRDHSSFSCEYEIRECVCGVLLMVGKFFS